MYERILVPVDGSETSRRGAHEAVALARSLNASIRLVHVVELFVIGDWPSAAVYSQTVLDTLAEGGRTLLEDVAAGVRKDHVGCDTVLEQAIGTRVADAVLSQARLWPADLIVMGTHGRRGLARLVMGSTAEYVLRHSPVPMLLVRKQS